MNRNKLLSALTLLMTLPAMAGEGQLGTDKTFNFSGTLRAMTICRVNNDQIITADFKNVGINKLETEVYSLPLDYTLIALV